MQPNSMQRFILHPLRAGFFCALFLAAIAYLVLCVVHGMMWTTAFAPDYGLLIIRLAFGLLLGVVSLVTLPFMAGGMLVATSTYVLPIGFGLGFVMRLIIPADEEPSRSSTVDYSIQL